MPAAKLPNIRLMEDGTQHYKHTNSQGRLTEESTTKADGTGHSQKWGGRVRSKILSLAKVLLIRRHSRLNGRLSELESRQNGEVSNYSSTTMDRSLLSSRCKWKIDGGVDE